MQSQVHFNFFHGKKILWRDFASMYVMYDEENQKARDPLSSWDRGDVHELRKSQSRNPIM